MGMKDWFSGTRLHSGISSAQTWEDPYFFPLLPSFGGFGGGPFGVLSLVVG